VGQLCDFAGGQTKEGKFGSETQPTLSWTLVVLLMKKARLPKDLQSVEDGEQRVAPQEAHEQVLSGPHSAL
jgi:hypothetical protein